MAVQIRKSRYSWTNYCGQVETVLADESDLTYQDVLIPPEIPEADNEREHKIAEGDRIDLLSYKYFGRVDLWWVIALRNDLDLPDAQLVVGRKLIVPSRDFVESRLVR